MISKLITPWQAIANSAVKLGKIRGRYRLDSLQIKKFNQLGSRICTT